MTVDLRLWREVPTYGEIVRAIQKDFKVKLPARTALTFWDSFAMSQYRDMVAGLQSDDAAGREHAEMQGAVAQAAEEEGVSRREMMQFMTHLQSQNTAATRELQARLDDSARAQRQALQEQGTQFAEALAQESQRADRRDRISQEAMQALRDAPRSAPQPGAACAARAAGGAELPHPAYPTNPGRRRRRREREARRAALAAPPRHWPRGQGYRGACATHAGRRRLGPPAPAESGNAA